MRLRPLPKAPLLTLVMLRPTCCVVTSRSGFVLLAVVVVKSPAVTFQRRFAVFTPAKVDANRASVANDRFRPPSGVLLPTPPPSAAEIAVPVGRKSLSVSPRSRTYDWVAPTDESHTDRNSEPLLPGTVSACACPAKADATAAAARASFVLTFIKAPFERTAQVTVLRSSRGEERRISSREQPSCLLQQAEEDPRLSEPASRRGWRIAVGSNRFPTRRTLGAACCIASACARSAIDARALTL